MSDELSPSDVVEPDPDIDKTPTQADEPKPASSGVWAMPEPVFKKTSGYLPQGFNKEFTPAPRKGNEDTTVEQPKPEISKPQPETSAPNIPDVEPQPDVIEDGSLDSAIVALPPTPQKKGIVGRLLMILLALIIVVLMSAVVVGVIWFVLWPRPEGTIN